MDLEWGKNNLYSPGKESMDGAVWRLRYTWDHGQEVEFWGCGGRSGVTVSRAAEGVRTGRQRTVCFCPPMLDPVVKSGLALLGPSLGRKWTDRTPASLPTPYFCHTGGNGGGRMIYMPVVLQICPRPQSEDSTSLVKPSYLGKSLEQTGLGGVLPQALCRYVTLS